MDMTSDTIYKELASSIEEHMKNYTVTVRKVEDNMGVPVRNTKTLEALYIIPRIWPDEAKDMVRMWEGNYLSELSRHGGGYNSKHITAIQDFFNRGLHEKILGTRV